VLSAGAIVGDYTIVAACATSPTASIFRIERRSDRAFSAALKVWHRSMPALLHDGEPVRHAGLTRVLESGQLPDGRTYHIKEWVDGQSLADVLAERKTLSTTRAIAICDMLIAAVQAAKRRGRYFLKFATDDVMLASNGDVKLLHDGIPRGVAVQELLALAPTIAAPELAGGAASLDGAVEIYSFGVLLHEMIFGKLPLGSDVASEPNDSSPSSSMLREVVRRCLEVRPEKRFANLDELRSALVATPATQSISPTLVASEPTREAVGPSLDGYEIVGELGRGGMAVVYKARHVALNRTVAIKMFVSRGGAAIVERKRFRTEAETIAGLQHPNIVQVYETGVTGDDVPYHALELVEGGSLDRYHGVAMPPREAAHVVETIARAVDYAHRRSVIHRDLKPSNVLLSSDGTPKVSDFGIAKRVEADSRLTQTGVVLGTPSYMAPEQAHGDAHLIGPATDVYGLGTILYSLLTGRPPFQATTAAQTIQQVIETPPLSPRRLQPDTPRDLEVICLKCLEKEPSRRYSSAAALADDLQRYATDRPISARATPRRELLRRWARRNRSIAWLGAGVLFAVIAIAVSSTLFAFRLASEKRQASENGERAEDNARAAERNRNAAADAFFALVTKVDRSLAQRSDSDALRQELLADAISRLETIRKSGHAGALEDKTLGIAYERMGTVVARLGRRKDAKPWFERAIALLDTVAAAAGDSIAYFSLAVAHEQAGDADPSPDGKRRHYLAMQTAVRALEAMPRDAEVPAARMLVLRAALDVRLARVEQASRNYRLAIGDYAMGAAAGEELAALPPPSGHWFFTSDKDSISAGRSFAVDGYLHAGDVMFESLDDKEGALASYRKASAQNDALLAHEPENPVALGRRGLLSYRVSLCLFTLGRQQEGREVGKEVISQLEAALRSDPNNLEVRMVLIIAKARAGLHVQASSDAAELRKKVQGLDIGIAEIYAQCAFGVAQGRRRAELSSSEGSLYDRYLAEALAILHETAKRRELSLEGLKSEFELQPVRESPEYEALAKEVAAYSSPQ
jgi:serine/threonine protein kinase